MRFAPHRNERFQHSQDHIPSDYDSLSETEFTSTSESELETEDEENFPILHNKDSTLIIEDDNNDYNSSRNTTTRGSTVTIDEINSLLEGSSLEDKYKSLSRSSSIEPKIQDLLLRSVKIRVPTKDRVVSNPVRQTQEQMNKEPEYLNYLDQKFSERRLMSEKRLQKVIADEKERIAKEEEAKRLAEEERKRKEEEQRRRKEEEERRRLEEERKRQEEEERKRKEAEERKRQEEERIKKLEEKKQAELKEKEEQEKKQKELLDKKLEEEKKKLALEKSKKSMSSKNEITKLFLKYTQDISDIKQNVVLEMDKPENKDLKKNVGKHKRSINPKFGQLTDSQEQLSLVTSELKRLIDLTLENEKAKNFIFNFIAKAIVAQAESEVAVKANSSIALAKLAVNLLVLYPELEYFLMARFVKKCPLIIGYSCDIDTEEGRKRMGYKRKDGGKWETDVQYDERLGGIATVYCVMTRTRLDNYMIGAQGKKHPLPISKSWTMAARILNFSPDTLRNIHFVVIAAWWDSCALQVLQAYANQGMKLLKFIYQEWSMCVRDKKYAGAARLWLIGEEYEKTGNLKAFPELSR